MRGLGVMLLLAMQLTDPSHAAARQVAILTGQQLADEVVKWGMEGGDVTLVLSAPSITMRNATWPTDYPTPSGTPGSPFSSGRLYVTSANPQNRSILDMANRFGLVPYTRGTASVSMDSVITINACQFTVNHTSTSKETGQSVLNTYTSGLFLPLFNNPKQPSGHVVTNSIGYTTQADMAATLYDVLLTLTNIPPVQNLTKYRTEIFTGIRQKVTYVHPFSVGLEDSVYTTPAPSTSGFASVKSPSDPLLQRMKLQNTLMTPQLCNGSALRSTLATADVDPLEGPLWLTDNTDNFVQALNAASALTKQQAAHYGLPPAVLLSSNASITNINRLVWDVSYTMLLTGPYSSAQPVVVLDLAKRAGAFMLQPPAGQLAIQGLVLTGLATSDASNGAVSSAFPLSFVITSTTSSTATTASSSSSSSSSSTAVNAGNNNSSSNSSSTAVNASSSSNSIRTFVSSGTGSISGLFTPLWLDGVTLVLPPSDFVALAALVLSQDPVTGALGSVSACLDAATANVANYLATGISSLQALQPPADVPTEVLLAVFQGWGINGTSIRLVPAAAVSTSLAACSAGDSSSTASGHSRSSITTPQIVGLTVGVVAGALLILALALFAVVQWRRTALVARHSELVKSGKTLSNAASLSNGSSSRVLSASAPASLLLQSVQQREAQQTAMLASHIVAQLSSGAHSDPSAPGGGGCTPGHGSSSSVSTTTDPRVAVSGSSGFDTGGKSAGSVAVGDAARQAAAGEPAGSPKPALEQSLKEVQQMLRQVQPFKEVQQVAAGLSSGTEDKVAIAAILGQGASGTVFCGAWRGLPVALKTVVFPAGQAMEKVVTEVAIAASVVHPNVVATYHYDFKPISANHDSQTMGELQVTMAEPAGNSGPLGKDTDGACGFKLFLVQELCAVSLSDALDGGQLHDRSTGRVNEREAFSLLLDIARGLAYLHSKGVIHADLKPCNVLLKADGNSHGSVTAKLTDFGLSIHLPQGQTHVSGFVRGTPFYVAPEVVQSMHASTASDIYSLGVIMWQLYTGQDPWTYGADNTPAEWNPAFETFPAPNVPPEAYRQLMLSCLERDPARRPTAMQVVQIVTSIQDTAHQQSLPMF